MNQSSDDSRIRELVQRLKPGDARHLPEFDDILERPVRTPNRRPTPRLPLLAACCAAAILLAAFFFVRSPFSGSNAHRRPDIAERDGSGQPAKVLPGDDVKELDVKELDVKELDAKEIDVKELNFEDFQAVVDEYFRNAKAEAGEAPEWAVHTDSLLALNLEIPLEE